MGSGDADPRCVVGEGAIARMADLLAREQARRVLLVTGRDSYVRSGAEQALGPALEGRSVTRFHDFETNPNLPDVERGIRLCRDVAPDVVIAIGGGSVIDVAKAINVLSVQDSPPAAIWSRSSLIRRRGCPLIAAPTTAGSGSESTHFATIYLDGVKGSLTHATLRPDRAIVDPCLTYTLPARLTAVTGLDALAQAIESYWAVGATAESQAHAAAAIDLMWGTLRTAVHAPTPRARANMAFGAHLAGRAIDLSRTTAAHAISYPLTKRYGIPHGHAVALTLASFFEYNASARRLTINDPRGAGYVERTMAELCERLGCSGPVAAAQAWRDLVRSLDLATGLERAGVPAGAVDSLVVAVNAERLSNHPVQVTSAALRGILSDLVHA